MAMWKLPFRSHCNLLHGINDILPIDVILEQRCIKFIWTLLHSPNIIVKSVMRSAIRNGYSAFGENLNTKVVCMIYHQPHGYLNYVKFINV